MSLQPMFRRGATLLKPNKIYSSQSACISLVAKEEIHRFISDALKAVGTPENHASVVADVLLEADYRGHHSHGLGRLDVYTSDVSTGSCDPSATPKILKESVSTVWVDGQRGLGPIVGEHCMAMAIKKAADSGIAFVAAKGSNHFGIAAWYSMMALKQGMLGMSFTNTSPVMSPTRSKGAALGTNPLSLAAPSGPNDSVLLDMATTAAALGKIEVKQRMNQPIPPGWAQGPDGKPTTDADLAYRTSCLQPLGGTETTAGYKGYGLSLMVESDFNKPVLIPGDPERAEMEKVDKEGGIRYPATYIQKLAAFAKSVNIAPIRVVWTK